MKKENLKDLIGKSFTAVPSPGSPWVTTSNGNNNEKDYYIDVYDVDLNTGNTVPVYMYGESCEVKEINSKTETIKLFNADENYLFEISFKQFATDFGVEL